MNLKMDNKNVLKYIMEESEICEILTIRLSQYYSSLPREIDLISNNEVTSQYPDEDEGKFLSWLNLLEQIG